jgi:GTPase SAR1 family protein
MKVLFVGDRGTGKSTVLRELAGIAATDATTKPTQGCHLVKCTVNEKKFEVWDVSGDPKYAPFRASYFWKADACVFFGDDSAWKQSVLSVSPNTRYHTFSDVPTLAAFLSGL